MSASSRHSRQPVRPADTQVGVSTPAERLKDDVQGSDVASATGRLIAGFVALVFCLTVLGVLAAIIRRQQLNQLDAGISPFLHGLASPGLDALMEAATFVGSDPVLIGLFGVAISLLLVSHRPRREPLFLTAALLGCMALNEVLKLIFERARPQFDWAHVPTDYSFPSGHSMNSFVLYGSLALLIWVIRGRRAGVLATAAGLILVLTIGLSRIYLGAHYFTDVVGGFTAGLLWLLVVAGVFELAPRMHRRWRS